MNPGSHAIDHDEYLADPCIRPSLSCSIAKILIAQSPMHAWMAHPRLNPDYMPHEDSRFDVGSAAHALLLEGDDRMAVIEADDWRTKAAKEARDEAREAGKLPVLAKHAQSIRAMVNVARDSWCATIGDLGYAFEQGSPEHTIIWDDIGTQCRSRLDWLADDAALIIDYKATTDANPEAFARQILRMGYDVQAAFYARGVRALMGREPKFVFLVQEVAAPYACTFVGMPPAFMALGEAKVNHAIRLWSDCLRADKWPAYPNRVHWIEPPPWAFAKTEESIDRQVDEAWLTLAGQA